MKRNGVKFFGTKLLRASTLGTSLLLSATIAQAQGMTLSNLLAQQTIPMRDLLAQAGVRQAQAVTIVNHDVTPPIKITSYSLKDVSSWQPMSFAALTKRFESGAKVQKDQAEQQTITVAVQDPKKSLQKTVEVKIETKVEPKEEVAVQASLLAKLDKIGPALEAPEELFDLDNLVKQQLSARHANFPSEGKPATEVGEEGLEDSTDGADLDASSVVESSFASVSESINDFYRAPTEVSYRNITVQLIDDRSVLNGAEKQIYPVIGATVHVVGTEFWARTDSRGIAVIKDMPTRSRVMLLVDDPTGVIKPAIAEINTNTENNVVYLKAMRFQLFDTYERIAGLTQDTNNGSLCGVVSGLRSRAGVKVSVDARSQGPYYFNQFGFLDQTLQATAADGKFCFFNIEPGPVSFSFSDKTANIATIPSAAFIGRHQDQEFNLTEGRGLRLSLGSYSTAHEQLGSDETSINAVKEIDMIDMIPLGVGEPLTYLDNGVVGTADELNSHMGRVYAFAQASEFEPILYTLDSSETQNEISKSISLLPRGFIEDMSVYAQVVYDPSLGVVIAEHAALVGQDAGAVNFRLQNERGEEVGDGWYFADEPVTKVIFFNLEPGMYSLMVETADGYWLAAQTVLVFNETVSFVSTGAELRKRSPAKKIDDSEIEE